MIKSLRWRLQIWHAAILGVAIVLFGTAFFVQLQRSTYGEIDLELLSGARVLEGALRSLPPRNREGDRPLFPQLRFSESGPAEGRGTTTGGMNGDHSNDRNRRPGPRPYGPLFGEGRQRPPTPEQHLQNVLSLPPFFARGPHDTAPYFAVYAPNGELIEAEAREGVPKWAEIERPISYRFVGRNREVLLRGPGDTLIIVGRDIHSMVDRLRGSLVQLFVIGAGVLGLGLVGGWWLSGKAIRPIQQISATAGKINASNLSDRIETSGMDDELRALATILNSMFGRLDRAFIQQSQFTADASHELRTPLAVLMSHCELALNRPRNAEEYKQTIATCQKAGSRMSALVEDLLTLARADAGRLEIVLEMVDLNAIAREVITQLEPIAQERGISIEFEGGVSQSKGDPRRLSQVFANLISNAVHYNNPGGKVVVSTLCDEEGAVAVIRDTGIGIPERALPHLFDRFFRVDDARSRQTGGSGLGLAICKSIVEAHGGSISVQSELGVGTTFQVRLPSVVST